MTNALKKILALLTPRERRQVPLVFGGMVVSALVEVAGIASIMPFLALLGNPEMVHTNGLLDRLFTALGFASVNRFLLFLGILVLVALVISNIMAALVNWALFRFSWMRNHTLSRRLLARYLHQPYVFFLNQNTATLGRNILSEVQQVVSGVLIPGMQMLAQGIVVVFIMAIFIAVNPLLALVVALSLGGAYAAIYLFVRRKLTRIGRERVKANEERFKTAGEAFGGIKAVKLLGGETLFAKRYAQHSYHFSDCMATAAVISYIPRYALEIVAFGGILVIVLSLLAARGNLGEVLPLLGLYVFGGYRMMPALQQVFFGATQIRFNLASLDMLSKDMQSMKETEAGMLASQHEVEPLPFHETLKLDGVTFRYPGVSQPAVRDVDLTIKAGSAVALVGKTGSGKTTIADLILGLLAPESGTIRVDGVQTTEENLPRWQRNLGYVPQDIYLLDDTVVRNIAFGVGDDQVDMAAVQRAARIANIHDFIVSDLSNGYDTVVGDRGVRLSGGERQRIGIARALYHDPQVLVLDEATSALDGGTEDAVLLAIRNVAKVKTLIIVAHRLATVRDCDEVYVVERGRIAARGTYDELMSSCPEFRKMAKLTK